MTVKKLGRPFLAPFLLVVGAGALWAVLLLFAPSAQGAETEFRWRHFGADPFAKTRSEAMAQRERVFRESFGFSNACVSAALRATESPPHSVGHLNVGDRLSVMVSGGFVAHRSTVVDFPPVRRGINYAATVEIWEFDCDGFHQKIGLPEICNNWSLFASVPVPQKPAPVRLATTVLRTGACPNGFSIIANAWSLAALPPELRKEAEEHIAAAIDRDTKQATRLEAYQAPDVSRTMGKRLRQQVRVRAPVTADIPVRFVESDGAERVLTREVGVLHMVNGVGTFRFSEDPRQSVIGMSWPQNFISPEISGGERRLRIFPSEWGNWCALNVHGLVP